MCKQPPRGGGVPPRLRHLTERKACQRGGALVPGRDLGAQCLLEQCPGLGVLIASEEELALSLARLCCALLISCLPVEQLGAGIQPVGLGEVVQLHRQVGPSECDARPCDGRRPDRIRETLRAAEHVERRLKLTRRRECTGELASHRERVGERTGPVVNRQCVEQRGPRRGIVAATQLELAKPVQGVGLVGPLLARAPGRERVAVQRLGAREVAGRSREAGEIHQVGRRDLVAPVTPVELERRLELAACFVRVPGGLREQPQIVVIGGDAAGIPDALAQGEGVRVPLVRRGEIAAIRTRSGERAQGVRFDPNVPDRGGEGARALEVRARAVEPTLPQETRPDVAQHGGNTGRIVDRPCTLEGPAPDGDCDGGAGPAVGRDARATRAVRPDLRRPSLPRPRLEPRHLAHQKRIAPCLSVGRS